MKQSVDIYSFMAYLTTLLVAQSLLFVQFVKNVANDKVGRIRNKA